MSQVKPFIVGDDDKVHCSKFMLTFNFRLQGLSVQPILKTSSLFYHTFTESTQDHQYLAWEFLWEGKAFPITVKPPVSATQNAKSRWWHMEGSAYKNQTIRGLFLEEVQTQLLFG